jgi:hypothetical protein
MHFASTDPDGISGAIPRLVQPAGGFFDKSLRTDEVERVHG